LQAGDRFLLYSVPRYKLLHEKNIKVYSASLDALPSRAAGVETTFVFASFFNLQTQKLKMLAFAKR
jgi:hypothetical protein